MIEGAGLWLVTLGEKPRRVLFRRHVCEGVLGVEDPEVPGEVFVAHVNECFSSEAEACARSLERGRSLLRRSQMELLLAYHDRAEEIMDTELRHARYLLQVEAWEKLYAPEGPTTATPDTSEAVAAGNPRRTPKVGCVRHFVDGSTWEVIPDEPSDWPPTPAHDHRMAPRVGSTKTFPNGMMWEILPEDVYGVSYLIRICQPGREARQARITSQQWARGGQSLAGEDIIWGHNTGVFDPAPPPTWTVIRFLRHVPTDPQELDAVAVGGAPWTVRLRRAKHVCVEQDTGILALWPLAYWSDTATRGTLSVGAAAPAPKVDHDPQVDPQVGDVVHSAQGWWIVRVRGADSVCVEFVRQELVVDEPTGELRVWDLGTWGSRPLGQWETAAQRLVRVGKLLNPNSRDAVHDPQVLDTTRTETSTWTVRARRGDFVCVEQQNGGLAVWNLARWAENAGQRGTGVGDAAPVIELPESHDPRQSPQVADMAMRDGAMWRVIYRKHDHLCLARARLCPSDADDLQVWTVPYWQDLAEQWETPAERRARFESARASRPAVQET